MSTRPRGTTVYPMPETISGQEFVYGLLKRSDGAVRMVNTEGVGYDVTAERPWVWNDYIEGLPVHTAEELISISESVQPMDFADFVRVFGDRIESNFSVHHFWANH